jgi:ribosome-binding protein aMBF1 (putative translation factor)
MALCIVCGRKATLSIYTRILSAEITLCKECVLESKEAA